MSTMMKEEKPEDEWNPPSASVAAIFGLPFNVQSAPHRMKPGSCCICACESSDLRAFPSNEHEAEQREWITALLPLSCAKSAAGLLKRHRVAIEIGDVPRWCEKCRGGVEAKEKLKSAAPLHRNTFSPAHLAAFTAPIRVVRGRCCACSQRSDNLLAFPSNDDFAAQREWITTRFSTLSSLQVTILIKRHRVAITNGKQPRWCDTCRGGLDAKEKPKCPDTQETTRNRVPPPLPSSTERPKSLPVLHRPSIAENHGPSQVAEAAGSSKALQGLPDVGSCFICNSPCATNLFPPNSFRRKQQAWMSRLKCNAETAAGHLSRLRRARRRGMLPRWCDSCCGGINSESGCKPLSAEQEQQLEEITRRQKEALALLGQRHREAKAAEVEEVLDFPREVTVTLRGPSTHFKGPERPRAGSGQQETTHRVRIVTAGREASAKQKTRLRLPIARPGNLHEKRNDEGTAIKTEHVKEEEIGEELLEASVKEEQGSGPKRRRLTHSDSTLQYSPAEYTFLSNSGGETAAVKTEPVDVKEEDLGEQLLLCREEVREGWSGRGEQSVKVEELEDLSVYNPPMFLPLAQARPVGETEGEVAEVKEERVEEEEEEWMPVKQFLHRSQQNY